MPENKQLLHPCVTSVINGSQARFFNLQLYFEDANIPGEPDLSASNPPKIIQIGNECGFLPFPVALNNPPQPIGFDGNGNADRYTLLLASAERADIVIDFSQVAPGKNLILYNNANFKWTGEVGYTVEGVFSYDDNSPNPVSAYGTGLTQGLDYLSVLHYSLQFEEVGTVERNFKTIADVNFHQLI